MDTEQQVARHYTHGSLEQAVLEALKAGGKDIDHLAAADLSAADEFHLGWGAQTEELAHELGFGPGDHVLDIGSGIGGPARHFAVTLGCHVTGIDLTQEFVDVATALTRRCGLSDRVDFCQGSALAMPFPDGAFDGAILIHVGMNIPDKARLFAEARRVLRPGGLFGVYDIMRTGEGVLPYPMPWAATQETSFVEPASAYRTFLATAGFAIEKERDRREFTLKLGREMRENSARHGTPPLGLHVLMGPASMERLGNVMGVLERGLIAPTEIIARAI